MSIITISSSSAAVAPAAVRAEGLSHTQLWQQLDAAADNGPGSKRSVGSGCSRRRRLQVPKPQPLLVKVFRQVRSIHPLIC
jgi:hypothetical protein